MATTTNEGQRTLKGYRLLPETIARIEKMSEQWDCSAQEVVDRMVAGRPPEPKAPAISNPKGVARAAAAVRKSNPVYKPGGKLL